MFSFDMKNVWHKNLVLLSSQLFKMTEGSEFGYTGQTTVRRITRSRREFETGPEDAPLYHSLNGCGISYGQWFVSRWIYKKNKRIISGQPVYRMSKKIINPNLSTCKRVDLFTTLITILINMSFTRLDPNNLLKKKRLTT